jgi:hypothetical protein
VPRDQSGWLAATAACLVLFVAVVLGTWLLRRRRRRASLGEVLAVAQPMDDDSAQARAIRLAARARLSLSARFGPAIRARTTEELAADEQIREQLGADRFELLTCLLSRADRWKFATPSGDGSPEPLGEDITAWEALVSDLARNGTTR